MKYPLPLQKGDTIGLIAPSSPIPQNKILPCIEFMSSMGFEVVLGNSCDKSLHGYLSGADLTRAKDINFMFANPNIKAIFCLRGGYGSTRILHMIDYSLIKHNPKIFIGYSDVTSLHLAFHHLCELITFHGPMVYSNFLKHFDEYTFNSLMNAISIPNFLYFENTPELPFSILRHGFAEGRIVGGNLSLISSIIGTVYQPDFTNKILYLEDIGETIPRCDRLLWHLVQAGIFSKVNGVILGNFSDAKNPYDIDYTIKDYFKELFYSYPKPVIYGFQSDHEKPMGTIPLGSICTLDTYQNTVCFRYE